LPKLPKGIPVDKNGNPKIPITIPRKSDGSPQWPLGMPQDKKGNIIFPKGLKFDQHGSPIWPRGTPLSKDGKPIWPKGVKFINGKPIWPVGTVIGPNGLPVWQKNKTFPPKSYKPKTQKAIKKVMSTLLVKLKPKTLNKLKNLIAMPNSIIPKLLKKKVKLPADFLENLDNAKPKDLTRMLKDLLKMPLKIKILKHPPQPCGKAAMKCKAKKRNQATKNNQEIRNSHIRY